MKKMKYQLTQNAQRPPGRSGWTGLTRNAQRRGPNAVFKFFSCCFVLLICTTNALALSDKDKLLLLKNFPFLYMLEVPLQKLPKQPGSFAEHSFRMIRDAKAGIKDCKTASCFGSALQFTNEEIVSIGNDLVLLVMTKKSIGNAVRALKKNGLYPLFIMEPDTAYVRKVWQLEARGIVYILNTYLGGQKPLYPKIDSISFGKDDAGFRDKVAAGVEKAIKNNSGVFYSIPMLLALDALNLNERDEAARYEPLTQQENAAAYKSVKKIKWEKYPYSVILIPGLGPEQPGVKLDPNGAKRCDSAAVQYRAGKAPFLVVSGGHVHPNKTPYCEAVEMKKYMVEVLHIPAAAIIIEPHARHTTTNLRNTNRLIYRFKIPATKPVLIVTDAAQNNYINGNMRDKVVKELGYTPFSTIKKLSATESEYIPSDNSRQPNSMDPLDP
jgi:hypothetical protein